MVNQTLKQNGMKLKTFCPLFSKALAAGEVRAARQYLKDNQVELSQVSTCNQKILGQMKTRFPLFWKALVAGEVRKAHKWIASSNYHQTKAISTPKTEMKLPVLKIAQKKEEGNGFHSQQYYISKSLPNSLSTVKRARVADALKGLPLYWDALINGEVIFAREVVRLLSSATPKSRRSLITKQLESRYPRFWKAFAAGEVRKAEDIYRHYKGSNRPASVLTTPSVIAVRS